MLWGVVVGPLHNSEHGAEIEQSPAPAGKRTVGEKK